MLRKISFLLVSFVLVVSFFSFNGCDSNNEKRAKYVFFFIGDGMGYQQISLTQAYMAAQESRVDATALSFTQFPVTGISSTYCHSRYITDSAAAGTALATGSKTTPGTLGLGSVATDTLYSIAYKANKAGFKVGLATSVSIDHATPAAFYAHQQSRSMYHRISHDMINSNFRFFASGGFKDPHGEKCKTPMGCVFTEGKKSGYYFTSSTILPDSILNKYSSIVYTSPDPAPESSLKYQIDNKKGNIHLKDITKMGIDVLNNPKGFFFMVEGGKIDWACHDNDAATTIHDVIAFSDAVSVAFDFYKKFPNETLIIITADHETGGISVGNKLNGYDTNLTLLAKQKMSLESLNNAIKNLKKQNSKLSYQQTVQFLNAEFADIFYPDVIGKDFEEELKQAYKASISEAVTADQKKLLKKLYGSKDPIATISLKIINQLAGVGWTSTAHTGSHVPIYAIGAGQSAFSGQIDNTDIPKRIAKIMGVEP